MRFLPITVDGRQIASLFLLLILQCFQLAHTGFIIGCYYGYTTDPRSLTVDRVLSELCTHSFTFGGRFTANVTFESPPKQFARKLLKLKVRNPSLKVLLSFAHQMSAVITSDDLMQKFAVDVYQYLLRSELDGLDIDWEFPVITSGSEQEKAGFAKLLKILRKTFGHMKLLTIAVPAQYYTIDVGYNVTQIAAVDFINLMAYDLNFWTWSRPYTAHNSPFKATLGESYMGVNSQLNMVGSAVAWLNSGMPREKIAVGIPLYGRTYTLADSSSNQLYALATGPRPYSGYASQADICELLSSGGESFWDSYAMVPFCSKDTRWISYNDAAAVTLKVEWIKENGFGGAMVYDLNADDWKSSCAPNSSFPVTKVVYSILGS